MPFPAIVENDQALASLPDVVKAEYESIDGGKFRLKVTGAEEAFAAPLKANNQALKDEKDGIIIKYKPYDDLGLTPDQIKTLQTEHGTLKQQKLAEQGKVDELLASANEQFTTQLQARDAREQLLTTELSRHLVDAAAQSAIAAAQGNAKLLMGVIAPSLKMVEENGTFAVRVVDDKGNPRMTYKAGASAYMTIEDRVAELKADVENYGAAFKASTAKGSGTSPIQRPASTGQPTGKDMNSVDKIAAGLARQGTR